MYIEKEGGNYKCAYLHLCHVLNFQIYIEREIKLISNNVRGKGKIEGVQKKKLVEESCESNIKTVCEERVSSKNIYTFFY